MDEKRIGTAELKRRAAAYPALVSILQTYWYEVRQPDAWTVSGNGKLHGIERDIQTLLSGLGESDRPAYAPQRAVIGAGKAR